MNPNLSQCFIIGGGSSIEEGINKGLWEKLKDKFVIGINYSYRHLNSTIQVYLDYKFYNENIKDLDKLPLIITKTGKKLPSNTIQIKSISTYNRDVRKGCFKGSLSGIYALSLAIYLLDQMGGEGEKQLFLLGFDFCGIGKFKNGKAKTHYYDDIPHRGVGKINYYNTKGRADRDFAPFAKETKVKIFNVSLQSKINVFPKIDYMTFCKMLDNQTFNQEELRQYIKGKLK